MAHHQEKIAVSMRHWYLSLCMGGVRSAGWSEIQPADLTPQMQIDKHQCRIDPVIFLLMMGTWMPETCWNRNKYIKQNCAPSWTYLQDLSVYCRKRPKHVGGLPRVCVLLTYLLHGAESFLRS